MSDIPSPQKAPASGHYQLGKGKKYFEWQKTIGEFGGWANQTKFRDYVRPTDVVLDFGCGGGFLLKLISCARRIGVEPNPVAAETATANGVEVFTSATNVPEKSVDTVISNNALEHTLNPLAELQALRCSLKCGGKIVIVVPCENINYRWARNDINHHLFSWSPCALGNLLSEAGLDVTESKPYIHKWPPWFARPVARIGGRSAFDAVCRIYGRIERSWFQVRAVAWRREE
jgi:SAM-dependent methyltransferase